MKNKIFIIEGPSGVGKDSIINELIKTVPNLVKAKNYTDRPPRPNEGDGAYFFISSQKFDELVKTGEIFEWEDTRNNGVRYGSSKNEVMGNLEQGKSIIKVVGVKKYDFFKEKFGSSVVGIFLLFDDLNNLKKRLAKRYPGITESELEIRYQNAYEKIKFADKYDFRVINPEGHPEQAVEEIKKIIENETND